MAHPADDRLDILLRERAALRRLAQGLLRDPHLAEDVTQDAAALVLGPPGGARPRNVGAWLRGVVRFKALRIRGREAQRRGIEARAARRGYADPAAETVIRIEERRRILDALARLREPYRTTLVLRYLEDLPPREIAARLDVSVETIYTRQKRGLSLMREVLDRDGTERGWRGSLAAFLALGPYEGIELSAGSLIVKKSLVAVAIVLVATLGIVGLPRLLNPAGKTAGIPEEREPGPRVDDAAHPAQAPSAVGSGEGADSARPRLVGTATGPAEAPPNVEAAARPPARLGGTVREAGTGLRLGGVDVFLVEPTTVWEGAGRTFRARSNDEGRFAFDEVPVGRWVLVARSATHYMPETATIPSNRTPEGQSYFGPPSHLALVFGEAGGEFERYLRMARGHAIEGTVVDEEGAPIAGASVEARNNIQRVASHWGIRHPAAADARVTTDAKGRFRLDGLLPLSGVTRIGPRGSRGPSFRSGWRLKASKAGHAVGHSPLAEVGPGLPTPDVRIVLARAGSLAGLVTDAEGTALPDVWLRWDPSAPTPRRPGVPRHRTQAGSDGRFTLTGLPSGHAGRLVVEGSGAPTHTLATTPLAPGEDRTLTVVLPDGAVLRGRLVDEAGAPLPAMRITYRFAHEGTTQRLLTRTSAEGRFRFHGLPSDAIEGMLHAEVEPTLTLRVADGVAPAEEEREFTLERTLLRLRVVDEGGTPVPLCRVVLARDKDKPRPFFLNPSDPFEVVNGELDRTVEGAGPFRVHVSSPRDGAGRPLNLQSTTVEMQSLPVKRHTIRLHAGLQVRGIVLDDDTKPVTGASVSANERSTRTGADGRFVLGGLAEASELELQIAAPDGFAPADPVVVVPSADPPETQIVLQRLAMLAGQLRFEDDTPVPTGRVIATWTGADGGNQRRLGQVASDGTFRIVGIEPGATLRLEASNWAPSVEVLYPPTVLESIAAGTEDLVITLVRGFTIEGVVLAADGSPEVGCNVLARMATAKTGTAGTAETDASGRFRLQVAKPGAYDVRAFRGSPITEEVRVEAPTRGVELRVDPVAYVEGRLADLGGRRTMLRAWPEGEPAKAGRWVAAAKDGTFRLGLRTTSKRLVVGGYTTDGDAPRYILSGALARGSSGIVLPSSPCAALRITLQGLPAPADEGTRHTVRFSASSAQWVASGVVTVGEDGVLELTRLPPGRYDLRFEATQASGGGFAAHKGAEAGGPPLTLAWQVR